FAGNSDRLHPAVSAFEEIQIHRGLGRRLRKVGLDPQPFLPPGPVFRGGQFEVWPASRSIHQGPAFKLPITGRDAEGTAAGYALYRNLLPGIYARASSR